MVNNNRYAYFKRDVSWLSFNYRVLMEAEDASLSLYERINFLSIYSSNLEEFYEIRVAEHRGIIMKKKLTEEPEADAEEYLAEITAEVNRQQREYYRIFFNNILPELKANNIHLYLDSKPEAFHEDFVRNCFNQDIFPFLAPVMIQPNEIRTFIRDRRLYLVVRMTKKNAPQTGFHYALMKIPFSKAPRFIELPVHEGVSYLMFIDDVIRANLGTVFPGYDIDCCHSIKISRDADIYFEDDKGIDIVTDIRNKIKKRKTGDLSRFMYDNDMPADMLDFLCEAFNITNDDLIAGGRYLNLKDLNKLPNHTRTSGDSKESVRITRLDAAPTMFAAIKDGDVLLHFPYHPFDYLIRLLKDAAFDETVEEIKITQYRVAENSLVINHLISAAQNGKKVTVFVELKARYDEENNMSTSEQMNQAGIRIIFSLPGLKVHSKVALVLRRPGYDGIACFSTGNFNEKTAGAYSDMALLTMDRTLVKEVEQVFSILEGNIVTPTFDRLLVARFNMVDELKAKIRREMENASQGRRGKIILKMNGLHEREMIDLLYEASETGVEIDLIVRGICCLVPDQPYSRNIRITRIVDMYLEHSRVWYFYNEGKEDVYISSADWMRRNLSRRIEVAVPILDPAVKQKIIEILNIQLSDNVKACFIDGHLNNVFKPSGTPAIRAQQETVRALL